MFDRMELVDKINRELKGKGKTYIGYDLGAGYGEISVFTEQDLKPVTLLSRRDATVFHFPCMLVKYNGRFYAGLEAVALAGEPDALVFEDLLEIAMKQNTIVAGGQRFETDYLLGLFLKLTLTLPDAYGKVEKAGAIMFTTYIDEDPALQNRVYEVLTRATARLFGKKTRLYLQTRSESIFYFLMHQEESLYREDALICDYQKDYLKSYYFHRCGVKAPFTVSVSRRDYPDMQVEKQSSEEILDAVGTGYLDETFRQVIWDLESKQEFGLTYLIGDGFKGGWMNQSLNQLCEHGRVFQGNNLYSLGACYCLKQLVEPTKTLEEYIYLSEQDISVDVGLYCQRQGVWEDRAQSEYLEIFERGSAYASCKKTLYLIPQGESALELELRSLHKAEPEIISIDVSAFPQQQAGFGKWKLTLEFSDSRTLQVTIEDIGLGQVMPGSGKILQKTIYVE